MSTVCVTISESDLAAFDRWRFRNGQLPRGEAIGRLVALVGGEWADPGDGSCSTACTPSAASLVSRRVVELDPVEPEG